MRLILRIVGTWLLGIAVILLIIDGTKSLGANTLVVTSLEGTWTSLSATSLEQLKAFLDTRFFGPVLEPVLTGILALPGFVVLGVPGMALAALGRARRRRHFIKQGQF